jgi:hypothetical protein
LPPRYDVTWPLDATAPAAVRIWQGFSQGGVTLDRVAGTVAHHPFEKGRPMPTVTEPAVLDAPAAAVAR